MSPPSPRHPQRRAELVAAAQRVAAEQGLAKTNVRTVAAEAAVSPGSVLYYFPTFDELIYESVEGVVEELVERRRRIVEHLSSPTERIRALIAAGIPDSISNELRVLYESVGMLRVKPEYRPLMRSVVDRQVMLYLTTIDLGAALGEFQLKRPSAEIARNIVALEDAYDLYPLVGVDMDRESIRTSVMGYASLALGVDIDPAAIDIDPGTVDAGQAGEPAR
ncbi:MAG: TetR/AcrR family transcriptional regulator [Beutenbergiaceae bacterium]